jgi:hypothetical protein
MRDGAEPHKNLGDFIVFYLLYIIWQYIILIFIVCELG